jgi:hypothetical protein
MQTAILRSEFESMIDAMTADDMPNEDTAEIAGICGTEVAIALLRNVPGMIARIPKRNTFHKIVKRFVLKHFDGSNAKKLASVCGCSLPFIYRIIGDENLRRADAQKTNFEQLRLPLFRDTDKDSQTKAERSACNG